MSELNLDGVKEEEEEGMEEVDFAMAVSESLNEISSSLVLIVESLAEINSQLKISNIK